MVNACAVDWKCKAVTVTKYHVICNGKQGYTTGNSGLYREIGVATVKLLGN